jgi:hypothetical protein
MVLEGNEFEQKIGNVGTVIVDVTPELKQLFLQR